MSSNEDVGRIHTTGENNQFIIIGHRKYLRSELMEAFGGTLNPGLSPPPTHGFANPSPLGLTSFALTTFVLSMYNARAMGITHTNAVVGLTAFYGGAVQFLAGVWEIMVGNTFGGTAFCSYGAFWLSYMAINIEGFGIAAAYGDDSEQLGNAVGFFLLGWGLFTAMLVLCTMKSTVGLFSLFFTLTLTFLLLAGGEFTGKVGVTRAGGVVGVITAMLGFYNGFAGTANHQNSYFVPHPMPLTRTKK
ncbi:hypothetical protein CANTEDRAFT_112154 [Yamadazyma tenuis ATCC 10573]|nr:uncharacterized protein CANTEDRAFT_112154 [Yamadazyma tenuis ATCC 10573]EGV66756.1 hypothetical protein CANTEDRAFT_112154 [Yamadazyma tenuis ATCC 10573]